MLTRETLQALNMDDLKKVYFDALKDANATGVQLKNKKKPRVEWLNLVAQEVERRRRCR
jgi:hypothetical protein